MSLRSISQKLSSSSSIGPARWMVAPLQNWVHQIVVFLAWLSIFLAARFDETIFYAVTGLSLLFLTGYLLFVFIERAIPAWNLWATLVVISIAQNILIGMVVAEQVTPAKGKVLIGLQFLYILLLIGIGVVTFLLQNERKIKVTFVDLGAAIFIAIVLFEFITSNAGFTARLAGLRNMIGGTLVYFAVRCFPDLSVSKNDAPTSYRHLQYFTSFLAVLVLIVAWFGIIEYVADLVWDSTNFYLQTLNAEQVFEAKLGQEGIPSGVYRTNLAGFRFNRLISVYYEAINPSYFFACTTLLMFAMRRFGVAFISLVALLLTFGKGGWLICLIALYVYVLEHIRISNRWKVAGYIIPICGYILLAYVSIFLVKTSATSHFRGLYNGFLRALSEPLGVGLGSGGAHGEFEELSFYQRGGESGVGFLLFTSGFLGFGGWTFWMYSLLHCLRASMLRMNHHPWRRYICIILGALFALTLTTFLQENALSTSANYLYFLCAGIAIRVAINQNLLKYKVLVF